MRLVFEQRGEHESQWAAVVPIAGKIGATPQTLLNRVRQHERDTGKREGITAGEAARERGPTFHRRSVTSPRAGPATFHISWLGF